jgi:hypothetical protein
LVGTQVMVSTVTNNKLEWRQNDCPYSSQATDGKSEPGVRVPAGAGIALPRYPNRLNGPASSLPNRYQGSGNRIAKLTTHLLPPPGARGVVLWYRDSVTVVKQAKESCRERTSRSP